MTRLEFETALDAGRLETRIRWREGDTWYKVRRNGKTKTWKRDPNRFQIPIKYRLHDTMRATNYHFPDTIDEWFRIVPEGTEPQQESTP